MASVGLEKEMNCSICLSLYTDPVTLRCGHNFCWDCIEQMLNTQQRLGIYTCPECRGDLQERPKLRRNVALCNVVDRLRLKRRGQPSLFCTYCVDSHVRAVIFCLLCEASLCDKHLIDHIKEPEHVLNNPSTSLKTRKCSVHKELLEYYCTEDAASICASCILAKEHQGHRVETLAEASENKKEKHLKHVEQKLNGRRKYIAYRFQSVEDIRRRAHEIAAEEVERVSTQFAHLRAYVDDLEERLLTEIYRQEQRVSSLSQVFQRLEIQNDELNRQMSHIAELGNMTDPLTVLQVPYTGGFSDPGAVGGDEATGGGDEATGGGDEATEGGDEATGGGDEATGGDDESSQNVEMILHISYTICEMIRCINVIFYLQDPEDLVLDLNTAQNHLFISEDLKSATWTPVIQFHRPITDLRFQGLQVMSIRGFTSGRHYWDVDISKSQRWRLGMCYPSIGRLGIYSFIGYNEKSWRLEGELIYCNQYTVRHDGLATVLPHQISSDHVRIYLDYEAGQLSFYELCDPIKHLHTFHAVFTEPLHAALFVYDGSLRIAGRRLRPPSS